MKGRIIIIILLFLMALVLLGVALVFYFQGEYFPGLNKVITVPFVEKQSNVVISGMLDNIKNVSTASYELNAKSDWMAYGSPFELDTNIIFDGRFDDKPQGKLTINNDIKIQNLTFLTSLEASFSDEKIYFQVSEIPALPFLDLQKIHNKWYEMEWDLINFGNFSQIYDSINNVMSLKERLPDEIIDDQLSYHYIIEMNPDNFDMFYSLLPEEGLAREIFRQENYDQFELNLWISKDNYYLTQATSSFSNDLLSTKITLEVTNYNEAISIDKPAKGAELNTLVKDVFGQTNILDITVFSYLVGIDDKYFVADKDKDKLYLMWEDLFGTDDNNTDTDGDGFNDINEIKNAYNPNGDGALLE
ncbi:MAG: hypothetical protein Q8P20_08490 [bacterium]|nr:hypothetical protein [bacterium]